MKTKSTLVLALLSALAILPAAHAASHTGMKPAMAASAAPSKSGELSVPNQDKGGTKGTADTMGSTKTMGTTRAEVKADAASTKKSQGDKSGELTTPTQDKGMGKGTGKGSTTTRADVKADAAATKKAGGDKGGELPTSGQEKGGTKP